VSRRSPGFVLVEALAAAAVAAAALGMLVAILGAARRAQRAQDEAMAAWTATQGAYERLRGAPLSALPDVRGEERKLELPPELSRLRGAVLSASCQPWKSDAGPQPGLRRLRVALSWEIRPGRTRQVACEGLISDARQR